MATSFNHVILLSCIIALHLLNFTDIVKAQIPNDVQYDDEDVITTKLPIFNNVKGIQYWPGVVHIFKTATEVFAFVARNITTYNDMKSVGYNITEAKIRYVNQTNNNIHNNNNHEDEDEEDDELFDIDDLKTTTVSLYGYQFGVVESQLPDADFLPDLTITELRKVFFYGCGVTNITYTTTLLNSTNNINNNNNNDDDDTNDDVVIIAGVTEQYEIIYPWIQEFFDTNSTAGHQITEPTIKFFKYNELGFKNVSLDRERISTDDDDDDEDDDFATLFVTTVSTSNNEFQMTCSLATGSVKFNSITVSPDYSKCDFNISPFFRSTVIPNGIPDIATKAPRRLALSSVHGVFQFVVDHDNPGSQTNATWNVLKLPLRLVHNNLLPENVAYGWERNATDVANGKNITVWPTQSTFSNLTLYDEINVIGRIRDYTFQIDSGNEIFWDPSLAPLLGGSSGGNSGSSISPVFETRSIITSDGSRKSTRVKIPSSQISTNSYSNNDISQPFAIYIATVVSVGAMCIICVIVTIILMILQAILKKKERQNFTRVQKRMVTIEQQQDFARQQIQV